MRTIQIRAAAPCHENGVVPRLTIVLEQPAPNAERLDEVAMQAEAEILVDALYAALPVGTLDRVLAELLRREASSITTAHTKPRRGWTEV